MSNEPIVTIVGNVGADPEIRFTPGGKAVASFNLVNTPREKDGNEWKDGEPTWFRVTAWEGFGENVAESVRKGQRVIVVGRLKTSAWTDKEGGKRTSLEIQADAIGPDLRWSTAAVTRNAPTGGGFQRQQGAQDDPWATHTSQFGNEAPF